MFSAATFNAGEYVTRSMELRDGSCEARIEATREDPMMFALVYLPDHLRNERGLITFADFHVDLAQQAVDEWMKPLDGDGRYRDCYVASRGSGKSTWLFLILPLWAAAHGYLKYAVAFSDSAEQSKTHLATFRNELDFNDFLQSDYPELCEPLIRQRSGRTTSQSATRIQQTNEFVFDARGAGSAVRGMKVGSVRPQLIILDDIEPGEEKYDSSTERKLSMWLRETIKYLNLNARVVLVGTVTKVGSVVHQLLESKLHPESVDGSWVLDLDFSVHYYPPIVVEDDGTERSTWPGKWSLEWLKAEQGKADAQKEMWNLPVNVSGDYWTPRDFEYTGDTFVSRQIISVDPATTSRTTSDFTGIAVLGWDAFHNRVVVLRAMQLRLPPDKLRDYIIGLVAEFEDVTEIVIESNQGGDLWKTSVLYNMPVPVRSFTVSAAKIVRIQRLHVHYQRRRVVHAEALRELETQMKGYRGSPYERDDMIDAVSGGVSFFIKAKKTVRKTEVRRIRYARV